MARAGAPVCSRLGPSFSRQMRSFYQRGSPDLHPAELRQIALSTQACALQTARAGCSQALRSYTPSPPAINSSASQTCLRPAKSLHPFLPTCNHLHFCHLQATRHNPLLGEDTTILAVNVTDSKSWPAWSAAGFRPMPCAASSHPCPLPAVRWRCSARDLTMDLCPQTLRKPLSPVAWPGEVSPGARLVPGMS